MKGIPDIPALSGLLARLRSLARGLFRRGDVEAEMREEFQHHIELRAEDLLREGLAPEEAARRARVEFGHVETHREAARASRGLRAFDRIRFSWLDVQLGLRILVRYPGLTVVAGLAMAFAIFIAAATFEFLGQMIDPTLPLPEGERVVGLRYWDRAENEAEFPLPYDLILWREELSTVEQLGGFRTVERSLVVGGAAGEPVELARISAVGFRLASVPPLLGRTLVEADEDPGASPVVVIGHRLWQARFRGDPTVVGRTVRLGDGEATVVGVMPEGFGFPQSHDLWTPLRPGELDGGPESGAPLRVFGRLAPGATLDEARAEAATIALHAAREAPARHEHLRVEVLPYTESLFGRRMGLVLRALLYQLNVYPALFLILVCGNIALLAFARATTRAREIMVRNALGASRGRIMTQLFVEALVLGTLATSLGLAATGPALRWVLDELREVGASFPFWIGAGVSATTVVYAAVLTLVGAAVAGVVPALKVTGRGMQARLHQAAAGSGGLRLGGIWTAVVVTQIAATVVFTGAAWVVARQAARNASVKPYFPAEQYVGANLEMVREQSVNGTDEADEAALRRFAADVRELARRVAQIPAVSGVTLADRLPVQARGFARIDVDDGGSTAANSARLDRRARSDAVDLDFFDVLRTPVVAGRRFDARDAGTGVNTVVVNASFVEEVLGGRSAIGRRIRYRSGDRAGEQGPWYEIVGVVGDLVGDQMRAMSSFEDPPKARIYHPLDPSRAGTYPLLYVIVHVPGDAGSLAPTLYGMADAVSPALRFDHVETLDRVDGDIALLWRVFAYVVALVSGVALFLSLAGIYAVMSFTVARRTREIGVRVALGANAPRVIAEIFRKPVGQVALGTVVGCVLMGGLVWNFTDDAVTARDGALLLALGIGTLGVCTLACIGPALRALRVEPMEALTAE